MKVLVCTHHFHSWAGSELVTIELFEELKRQGHAPKIFCPFVRPTLLQKAFTSWTDVLQNPDRVDLADYDVVIVLHQATARFLHLQDADRLHGKHRPFFIFLHLSPYEPFEAPGPFSERFFADMILANSEETREALGEFGYHNVSLFENPAPLRFVTDQGAPERLRRILSISNHVPRELNEALALLRDKGYEIYRIGSPHNARRVQPYDLFEADAVIATGKTVQCALRARRPVYCYDHFRGPGWIDRDFDRNLWRKFSGRCATSPKTPEDLAEDIELGYTSAREWVDRSRAMIEDRFALERAVERIIDTAAGDLKSTDQIDPTTRASFRSEMKLEHTLYSQIDRAYSEQTGLHSLVVKKVLPEGSNPGAIKSVLLREPDPDETMVIAVFSFRYDAHLVPALLENIAPVVHGYACWDDRRAPEDDIFSDEPARRKALFNAASAMGADWILPIDPDERAEDSLADHITDMTTKFGPVVWNFEFREMFTPERYRIDGIWNAKARVRLFPCLPGMEPADQALHGNWTRNALNLPIRNSELNIYHLRMATPERRALRHLQYALLDPEREFQQLGYDYLIDERGAQLEPIPRGREFSPDHTEDRGLWAAGHTLQAEDLLPDPDDMRLKMLMKMRRRGGYSAAFHQALDLHRASPEDLEFVLLAADCAMRARDWTMAAELAGKAAGMDSASLMAQLILTRSLHALGEVAGAEAALGRAEALAPGSRFCVREREWLRPAPARFLQEDALWRQWINGPAEIHAGASIANCDLCVVVLSRGAPDNLVTSVSSLCEQSVVPEIVVVNSDGGNVKERLGALAERVRAISVQERLYPGAVRNIGIDASCARYVAFLASDCKALPGNIEKRLSLHREGARAVSAFVLPENEGSVFQQAASLILHSTRHPRAELAAEKKYSISYDRDLFEDFGYFLPGLRVAEDTFFNNGLTNTIPIASDAGICISHHYPETRAALQQDMESRADHRMKSPLLRDPENLQELRIATSNMRDVRYEMTMRIIELRRAEFEGQDVDTLEQLVLDMLDIERRAAFDRGTEILRANECHKSAQRCRDTDGERALALLREAVELQPQAPWLQLDLALCLLSQGQPEDHDEATKRLGMAVDASMGEAKILSAQIKALVSIGEDEAARRAFERGCLLFPDRFSIWSAHGDLHSAGNRALRVYCLQKMFFENLLDSNVARALSENHFLSGNWRAREARARNSDIQVRPVIPAAVEAVSRSLTARSKSLARRLLS